MNIQDRYKNIVEEFTFVEFEENTTTYLALDDLDKVVKEIAEKIIAASDLRPMLSGVVGRPLSLRDTCYLVVQSSDEQSRQDTPARIKDVTEQAKGIVIHIAK